jgi:hypothetical protein
MALDSEPILERAHAPVVALDAWNELPLAEPG